VAYGSDPEGDSLGLLSPAGARPSFSRGKGLYCLHHLSQAEKAIHQASNMAYQFIFTLSFISVLDEFYCHLKLKRMLLL